MKRTIIIMLLLISEISDAQFVSAELKANGLTCSMCSFSIQKQLQTIDFIDSIDTDLEHNIFYLKFKNTEKVDFDLIKKGVEDAGFSVALLIVVLNSTKKSYDNMQLRINNDLYHIYGIADTKKLDGIIKIKLLDKGFVSNKEFKKSTKKMGVDSIHNSAKVNDVGKIKRVYHAQLL